MYKNCVLYGLPTAFPTGFSTDTLRASPRFFPRARTEAGEWRRKPHVKVPSPRTAARRMCAADVPTAFPRSAADWRTGRGADSIRMSPRAADARSAGGAADVPTDFLRSAAVCGIMRQFAAEDGVVLGTIDWATAADIPTWAARPVRRAARRPTTSCTRSTRSLTCTSSRAIGSWRVGEYRRQCKV